MKHVGHMPHNKNISQAAKKKKYVRKKAFCEADQFNLIAFYSIMRIVTEPHGAIRLCAISAASNFSAGAFAC